MAPKGGPTIPTRRPSGILVDVKSLFVGHGQFELRLGIATFGRLLQGRDGRGRHFKLGFLDAGRRRSWSVLTVSLACRQSRGHRPDGRLGPRLGADRSNRRLSIFASRQIDARLASGIASGIAALTPGALTAAAFTGTALAAALAATLPAVGPTFGAIAGIALPTAGFAPTWSSVATGRITAAATFAATARGATFAAAFATAARVLGGGMHGIDADVRPTALARTFDGHRR
jgi:hypothetical protein